MAKQGDWVIIHNNLLEDSERAQQVPDDTQLVPLEMWVKGYLLEDGEVGEQVSIQTVTNRIETGELVEISPTYNHSFGDFVPEILEIDRKLQDELYGGE